MPQREKERCNLFRKVGVNMKYKVDYDWLDTAIEFIASGVVNKMEHPSGKIVVYKVKDSIRVDIKHVLSED